MTEEKEKILNFAIETFLRNGFYKTTMDEIAAQLRMSKKTIYRNFPSKEHLVRDVTLYFLEDKKNKIKNIINEDTNAVLKLFNIVKFLGGVLSKISDRMVNDLQMVLPKVWEEVDNFRTNMITENMGRIIKQGQKEGYIIGRPCEIIIALYIASIRAIVNPDFMIHNKLTPKEALQYTIEIIMNGIMTEKGKKLFKKLNNGDIK